MMARENKQKTLRREREAKACRESSERIRARFLELLAADEPDHPWVKAHRDADEDAGEGGTER